MNKYYIAISCIILLSFAIGIYLYPQMPESMPSHWNAAGQVNGFLPKFWGLFLLPLMEAGLFLMFLAIPRIDPMKHNIAKFRVHFNRFILLLMGFFLYIYLLTILWAFGFTFQFVYAMVPAFSVLFYYAGVLTENAKQNWFIGIRTPWTLSSDTVWAKTHALGKWTFIGAGAVSVVCAFLGEYALWFMMFSLMAAAFIPIVYSYILWKRENPA